MSDNLKTLNLMTLNLKQNPRKVPKKHEIISVDFNLNVFAL